MIEEVKRGPGRPKQNEAVPVKKGNPTWSPADVAEIQGKEPGFTYRKVRKDPNNIAKKIQEGWEIVSAINGSGTTSKAGYGRIDDGSGLTSVREGSDWILAKMPEEMKEQRAAFYNEKTNRLERALYANAKRDIRQSSKGGAPVHGSVTIERRGVATVIQD